MKAQIENLVGFPINNVEIYETAFVHKSALNQFHFKESNERLEFIGDSVLGLVITEYLYRKYPQEAEGFMTKIKTKIVSGKSLAMLAQKLELHKYVIMNDKGMKQEWNKNSRILEDVYEALIGAIFLDQGIEKAKEFILGQITGNITQEELEEDTNYKDMLMKYVRGAKMGSIEYKVMDEKGPDHNKMYIISLYIENYKVSESRAATKKAGEQLSSKTALRMFNVCQ